MSHQDMLVVADLERARPSNSQRYNVYTEKMEEYRRLVQAAKRFSNSLYNLGLISSLLIPSTSHRTPFLA